MIVLPVAFLFAALSGVAVTGAGGAPPEIVFEDAGPFSPNLIAEIATMDADGRRVVERTHDGTNKFLPHFSPDGSTILYTKFVTGEYGDPSSITAVAVLDLASGVEKILQPQNFVSSATPDQPVWSPDGTRIGFGSRAGDGLWVMNADGSGAKLIGRPLASNDEFAWGDPLWSSDDWIYFTVGQNEGNCFKVRIDRMRPDGSSKTKITDGGPNCTPPGFEQSGDADPGISPDGKTLYSSRGLPLRVTGIAGSTVRHLFAVSTEPWTPGKPEIDLSARAGKNDCIVGVPKVSPDGTRLLLFLLCSNDVTEAGVTLTDTDATSWTFLAHGFGPDWNPAAEIARTGLVPPGRSPLRPRVVAAR